MADVPEEGFRGHLGLYKDPVTPYGRCVARYRVLHYKYGISRREAWLIARYLERLCGTVT